MTSFRRCIQSTLALAIGLICASAQSDPVPTRLVIGQFPSDDYAVVSAIVTDAAYGAVPDGLTDCTEPIQHALDAVSALGGGVVFLPSGRYLCSGSLRVPAAVTLRGDWKRPSLPPYLAVDGSILMPTGGRGDPYATPFMSFQCGSCIRNLTIWYPDQSANSIAAYPWTIATDTSSRIDNFTVENVTLVNPYQAIRFGPQNNLIGLLRNVYGTPLKTGVSIDFATDTSRFSNIGFSPQYWMCCRLGVPQSAASIKRYLSVNGTGLLIGRDDGQCLYNIDIEGYAVGIRGGVHASLNGVRIASCGIAVEIDEIGVWKPAEKLTLRSRAKLALPPDPRAARPLLFDVTQFGATADGLSESPSDNTPAFQHALDAAGRSGGGEVYVPAGAYRFNSSLTIPSGVELRGSFDAQHHTMSKGSLLLPVGGRGRDDGDAFLNLMTGSGVRGLNVWRPDRKIAHIEMYPWVVRSLGPRCWLMDFTALNANKLADFETYPGGAQFAYDWNGVDRRRQLAPRLH